MQVTSWLFRASLALSTCSTALAVPVAAPEPTNDPLKSLLSDLSLPKIIGGVATDLDDLAIAATAFASVIQNATPTSAPQAIDEAASALSRVFAPYATAAVVPNFIETTLELVTNGLCSKDLNGYVLGDTIQSNPANSYNNSNTVTPRKRIYPKASPHDAPYDQAEDLLRGAIHIPDTFTYGKSDAVPLILVPGTGAFGGANFGSNMIKLLSDGKVADIVWLNIPGALLSDIQYNAEFVAYAVHYISSITNKKVAVATWSQGSLNAAWAMQYWPSTRKHVSDIVNYSPDYYGTVLAYILAPGFPQIPSVPSVIQQERNSSFIATLRNGGGSSAYVPTTTIYSAFFDEIVEPQQGTAASGYLLDERHVGVTNNEIQSTCLGQPGGTLYTHEGVLYSGLAYALTVDALTHDGPGRVERLDLDKVCSSYAAPGLSLDDILATEASIPVAALNIFAYGQKIRVEPPIRDYAK